MYADIPDPQQSNQDARRFAATCPISPSDYLQKTVLQEMRFGNNGFRDSLGLNNFPRLIDGGKLSQSSKRSLRTVTPGSF